MPILQRKQSPASMYLMVSLVSGALSCWVFDPPEDVTMDELITELSDS